MTLPNSSRPVKHRNVRETPGTATSDPTAGALQLIDQLTELVRAGEMTDHLGVVRKAAKHLRVTSEPAITVENGGAHHGQ